jgi:hypothetical protein
MQLSVGGGGKKEVESRKSGATGFVSVKYELIKNKK